MKKGNRKDKIILIILFLLFACFFFYSKREKARIDALFSEAECCEITSAFVEEEKFVKSGRSYIISYLVNGISVRTRLQVNAGSIKVGSKVKVRYLKHEVDEVQLVF